MPDSRQGSSAGQAYRGYYRDTTAAPDLYLCSVMRGTPGGEYHRRFWQPVAYLSELGETPLRVRALGEDLVAFRDRGGRIGVLHLHCCHRNSSLEFGFIEERGLRCCYHGRLFDVDGTILDMPGEPQMEKLRSEVSQGAYPTHVFGGVVFAYMGPPERVPVFPMYDRFDLPGATLVPGTRWRLECNWLQIKENVVDPHHTQILHTIPQRRGMDHFAAEFRNFPELTWIETPAGVAYLAARRVGDKIWIRSAEAIGANFHCISSVFETGQQAKRATLPFMSFWTLPMDDENSTTFYVSHIFDSDTMPFEKRRYLEDFGQQPDRPYRDRQWIPGDYEAQVSQGPINPHASEHLGSLDRGIALFRRHVRRGIEAVERGQDPAGFYPTLRDVPPTIANDYVIPAAEAGIDPDNGAALRAYAELVGREYYQTPPMAILARELSA